MSNDELGNETETKSVKSEPIDRIDAVIGSLGATGTMGASRMPLRYSFYSLSPTVSCAADSSAADPAASGHTQSVKAG